MLGGMMTVAMGDALASTFGFDVLGGLFGLGTAGVAAGVDAGLAGAADAAAAGTAVADAAAAGTAAADAGAAFAGTDITGTGADIASLFAAGAPVSDITGAGLAGSDFIGGTVAPELASGAFTAGGPADVTGTLSDLNAASSLGGGGQGAALTGTDAASALRGGISGLPGTTTTPAAAPAAQTGTLATPSVPSTQAMGAASPAGGATSQAAPSTVTIDPSSIDITQAGQPTEQQIAGNYDYAAPPPGAPPASTGPVPDALQGVYQGGGGNLYSDPWMGAPTNPSAPGPQVFPNGTVAPAPWRPVPGTMNEGFVSQADTAPPADPFAAPPTAGVQVAGGNDLTTLQAIQQAQGNLTGGGVVQPGSGYLGDVAPPTPTWNLPDESGMTATPNFGTDFLPSDTAAPAGPMTGDPLTALPSPTQAQWGQSGVYEEGSLGSHLQNLMRGNFSLGGAPADTAAAPGTVDISGLGRAAGNLGDMGANATGAGTNSAIVPNTVQSVDVGPAATTTTTTGDIPDRWLTTQLMSPNPAGADVGMQNLHPIDAFQSPVAPDNAARFGGDTFAETPASSTPAAPVPPSPATSIAGDWTSPSPATPAGYTAGSPTAGSVPAADSATAAQPGSTTVYDDPSQPAAALAGGANGAGGGPASALAADTTGAGAAGHSRGFFDWLPKGTSPLSLVGPAVALGGLGMDILNRNQTYPGQQQQKAIADQMMTQSQLNESYQASGTLPPAMQAGVTAAQQAALAKIRSAYASMGGSRRGQMVDLESMQTQLLASSQQMAAQLYQTGVDQAKIAETIYQQIIQQAVQQDQALASGIGNLATAMATAFRPLTPTAAAA